MFLIQKFIIPFIQYNNPLFLPYRLDGAWKPRAGRYFPWPRWCGGLLVQFGCCRFQRSILSCFQIQYSLREHDVYGFVFIRVIMEGCPYPFLINSLLGKVLVSIYENLFISPWLVFSVVVFLSYLFKFLGGIDGHLETVIYLQHQFPYNQIPFPLIHKDHKFFFHQLQLGSSLNL